MKKVFSLSLLTLLFACGGNDDVSQESEVNNNNGNGNQNVNTEDATYELKIANWYAQDHPQNQSLEMFKEIVETETNGDIEVDIYPNNQLGPEEEFIGSVKSGIVEMGVPGMMMSNDIPLIALAEMPFLFEGWEHAQEALTGEIGEEITNGLIEEAGVRNLAWTVNGFRQFSANTELDSIDAFNNLRLRLPGVDYYVEMGEALGANVITMAFSELFTALEQGTVDAQDNPYPTVLSSSLYEVQNHMLESNHIFSPNLWIINEDFFQGLPSEYQDIIESAADEASRYNWEISMEMDEAAKQELKDNGITIVEPDDNFRNELVESQEEVQQWFFENYPGSEEVAERIRELAN